MGIFYNEKPIQNPNSKLHLINCVVCLLPAVPSAVWLHWMDPLREGYPRCLSIHAVCPPSFEKNISPPFSFFLPLSLSGFLPLCLPFAIFVHCITRRPSKYRASNRTQYEKERVTTASSSSKQPSTAAVAHSSSSSRHSKKQQAAGTQDHR